MGKMKRFLATLLVATMLIGNNGISYAAEIPGGTDEVAQETEVVEAEAESEAETDVAAESDQEEAQDASVENSASDSEQEETEAVEEDAQEVKEEAVEEPASEDEQTTEAAKDESEEEPASQSDGQDADDAAEEGRTEVSDTAETVEPAAPEEEETFEAGELVYPGEDYGKDYTVSLSYDADAKIPAGAELRVREIEKDTDEYNSYLESTQSAVEKGVADARFFDITIVAKKDGEEVEVQPQAQVRVNISYKEAIEVAAEDNGEIQAIHFDEEKEEPDVLDVETDDNEEVSEVEFKAESFSVYGVVYTVDFTYDGYTFSIPGEGSILLSALAEQLNLAEKNFALENVKDVTFSNNELLKIEKQDGGDWLLTSLKAFTSEETLTILMADGSKFLIVVTDAQGNSYDVVINFTNKEGTAQVTPDLTGQYSFVKAGLYDDDGNRIGYVFKRVDITSSSTTVNLDSFKLDNGSQITYAAAKQSGYYVDGIRLAHTTNQWDNPDNLNYSQYEQKINDANDPLTEGDYDAYTFVSNRRDADDPKQATRNTITIREADPVIYKVKVDCGDEPLKAPKGTDIYALVKIEYQSGALGWGIGKVAFTEGESTTEVTIENWFIQMQSWIQNYTPVDDIRISRHESKVSVALAAVPSGTTITSPADLANNTVAEGGPVQTHKVESYPSIPRDYDPTGITPPQRTIEKSDDSTVITDIVYLTKNNDKLDDTSLENLLTKYNVITLCPNDSNPETQEWSDGNEWGDGDYMDGNHTIGGILVRGDLIAYAQFTNIGTGVAATSPSAVGGLLPDTGVQIIGQGHPGKHFDFYVGDDNAIVGKTINGKTKDYNQYGDTVVNPDFVNWDQLQSFIISQSEAMLANSTRTVDVADDQTVVVMAGEHVTFNYTGDGTKVKVIIARDPSKTPDWDTAPGTIISISNSGTAKIPQLWMSDHADGSQPYEPQSSTGDKENAGGLSAVFNFPNATEVSLSVKNTEYGHVIAPRSFLTMDYQYNGCLIANAVKTGGDAEGHMWPYRGGKLVPSTVGLVVHKTVNGEEPTAEQVYTFKLDELQKGAWSNIQSKQNNRGEITFDEILYAAEATHWYLLYEDTTGVSGEPDTTWYVLKVVVTAHIVGEDTEYEQETTAYRVTDKDDLLLENGDVNTAAITEVGEGSKKGDPENITFVNEENGSLKVTKTFAGNTEKLKNEEKNKISFTVSGPEWSTPQTFQLPIRWEQTERRRPEQKRQRQ